MILELPPPPNNGPDIRNMLSWPVAITASPRGYIEIESSPLEKKHIIKYPTSGDPLRPIELQHEYVHAFLCEKIHHLFSGSVFVQGTDRNLLEILTEVFQSANDWFVDAVLFKYWPEIEKEDVREHLELMFKACPDRDIQRMKAIVAPFLWAQAEHFHLPRPIRRKAKRTFPKNVEKIKNQFLIVDPSNPTINGLEKLVDCLTRQVTRNRWSARIINDGTLDVWELVKCT